MLHFLRFVLFSSGLPSGQVLPLCLGIKALTDFAQNYVFFTIQQENPDFSASRSTALSFKI